VGHSQFGNGLEAFALVMRKGDVNLGSRHDAHRWRPHDAG